MAVHIKVYTSVVTTVTGFITTPSSPAMNRMNELVTTTYFVRNIVTTSTPKSTTMTPPATVTCDTPSKKNPSGETPPTVEFAHGRSWYIYETSVKFNTNGRVYTS